MNTTPDMNHPGPAVDISPLRYPPGTSRSGFIGVRWCPDPDHPDRGRWGASRPGKWEQRTDLLGFYPTPEAAAECVAAALLAEHGPDWPKVVRRTTPRKPRGKRASPRTHFGRPYIRVVGEDSVQARPHVGGGKLYRSLNLGTYRGRDYGDCLERAAIAAGKAAIEFLKRCAGPPVRKPWDVVREIQRIEFDGRPLVNPALLPKWVYRRADGLYAARNQKGLGGVQLPGPFPTPEEAHAAMAERLGRPCWV